MTSKNVMFLVALIAITAMAASDSKSSTTTSSTNQNNRIYVGLLEPKVRKATDPTKLANGKICGGTEREKIHFVTSYEFSNKFSWYVETPIAGAKCAFRISDAADQNDDAGYVKLYPQTKQYDPKDGFFACDASGYDSSYFQIPEEIDCDKCILEWIWRAPNNQEVRQCADIMVVEGVDQSCSGQCDNGGVCRKGKCICREGYSGDNCQNTEKSTFWNIFKTFLLLILLLAVLGGLGYFIYIFFKNRKAHEEVEDINLIQKAAPVQARAPQQVQERREFEEPPPRPMNDFDYLQANMAGKLRRDSDRESYRPDN